MDVRLYVLINRSVGEGRENILKEARVGSTTKNAKYAKETTAYRTEGGMRSLLAILLREYNIAPGDMVMIPRNTAHFMDPGSNRLGYLLVKVCD